MCNPFLSFNPTWFVKTLLKKQRILKYIIIIWINIIQNIYIFYLISVTSTKITSISIVLQ